MDHTTSDIPREVADVFIDLNIIAGIPTNCKLNTCDGTYVDADSFLDGLKRWFKGENRDSTIDYINERIDKAISVCKGHPVWAYHIAERVASILNALVNLEQTYRRKKDEETVSKINVIKLRIDKARFLRTCDLPL